MELVTNVWFWAWLFMSWAWILSHITNKGLFDTIEDLEYTIKNLEYKLKAARPQSCANKGNTGGEK